jgi:hypothetical protein
LSSEDYLLVYALADGSTHEEAAQLIGRSAQNGSAALRQAGLRKSGGRAAGGAVFRAQAQVH